MTMYKNISLDNIRKKKKKRIKKKEKRRNIRMSNIKRQSNNNPDYVISVWTNESPHITHTKVCS